MTLRCAWLIRFIVVMAAWGCSDATSPAGGRGGATSATGGATAAAGSGGLGTGGGGAGSDCVGANCACQPGLTACANGCVNLQSSAANCGVCGTMCDDGEVCSEASCQTGGCDSGLIQCGQDCVDTSTDVLNCGSCGSACVGGASCEAGACLGGTGGSGGMDATGGTAGSGGTGGTAGMGGTGGSVNVPFILGADISSVQESGASFRDTDGQTKSIFDLLKNHGFNYIRLKTFVDPSAPYGYASTANGCSGFSEPFGDRDHVVDYGKQVKDAGMGFLLDFHYSDVWADPGNQIIPEPWRNASSITELAALLKAYTKDVITYAIAQGARPDMVQVGNEITPGMLMHLPGPNTDCWGNNPVSSPVSGSTSNWDNLATLLKAGIEGVREVDASIEIVLHIENHSAASWWVDSAISRGVDFDILGISCYTAFQGEPSTWRTTFNNLATTYPDLDFIIAEYNPERTEANLIMRDLPDGRGRGTFFWEPTRSGEWGDSMFTWSGGTQVANSSDFAEYDALLPQLGL